MLNTAIVLGTSRINGNTHSLVNEISNESDASIFNLSRYNISPFDYQHRNRKDDFLPLVNELVTFEHIALASPVYWYSASSQMKVFIDRLSDLLTIDKSLGRKLRGKKGSVIATGSSDNAPACFTDAFQLTFSYLGMENIASLYCCCTDSFNPDKHRLSISRYIQSIQPQHPMLSQTEQ